MPANSKHDITDYLALGRDELHTGPPPLKAGTRAPKWFHRFVIDGWEYIFSSREIARKVRDELMRMTLEGEL